MRRRGIPAPSSLVPIRSLCPVDSLLASGHCYEKNEAEGSRAFFGILNREVEFKHAFFRSTKSPMTFYSNGMEHPVRFLGVRDDLADKFAGPVRVLAWRPVDGSRALQVTCKLADAALILCLPPRGQGFATACHWRRTWRSRFQPDAASTNGWNDSFIHRSDEIQIPCVTLDAWVGYLFPCLASTSRGAKGTLAR